ncbi:NrdH-redoxin [Candidatus Woesearchaeota archaeon CG10_big_fil_rev_8_21_14_0_10_30_7]|nr:MAG: NrdH-redoxin [Candidatus Woesearchaeota archaeon CG10_big_fil_rev_8_21_14_0_10_30_7]
MKATIYTTPSCPYCKMAKDYLNRKNVDVEEKDISKDKNARDEAIAKSGRMGVPVMIIGEQVIVGFDMDQIDFALKKLSDYN